MIMGRINKISFDGPATIAELIEALEDLRAQHGNGATPRFEANVTGGLSFKGYYVSSITVLPEDAPRKGKS